MRYPEFLKDGGTVGFIAPSYGCNMEPYKSAFANAQKKLRSLVTACYLDLTVTQDAE